MRKLCGEFWRHDYDPAMPYKKCLRCGALGMDAPVEARFWGKVGKDGPGGCWVWRGCVDNHGYGWFAWMGRNVKVHRIAWIWTYGEIPKGEGYHGTSVLHKCDNRGCVNPDHLFLGTQGENMRDMVRKGRKAGAKLAPAEVAEIKHLHKHGHTRAELATRFCVDKHTIYMVVSGKTWKSLEVHPT